jgi:hypothetical protein
VRQRGRDAYVIRARRGYFAGVGTLELPGFPAIPPSGRYAELPMRETIRIVNGLIVESRMEFDPWELRRRLGV